MIRWIFLLFFCNLWWSLSQCDSLADYEDWSATYPERDDYQNPLTDDGSSDDYINAELITRDEKRARFGSHQQQHLKHNWLEKFWSTIHEKGLSKRHLSAGEILQILRQASIQRGGQYMRGRLKGIRFGVSKRMLVSS